MKLARHATAIAKSKNYMLAYDTLRLAHSANAAIGDRKTTKELDRLRTKLDRRRDLDNEKLPRLGKQRAKTKKLLAEIVGSLAVRLDGVIDQYERVDCPSAHTLLRQMVGLVHTGEPVEALALLQRLEARARKTTQPRLLVAHFLSGDSLDVYRGGKVAQAIDAMNSVRAFTIRLPGGPVTSGRRAQFSLRLEVWPGERIVLHNKWRSSLRPQFLAVHAQLDGNDLPPSAWRSTPHDVKNYAHPTDLLSVALGTESEGIRLSFEGKNWSSEGRRRRWAPDPQKNDANNAATMIASFKEVKLKPLYIACFQPARDFVIVIPD